MRLQLCAALAIAAVGVAGCGDSDGGDSGDGSDQDRSRQGSPIESALADIDPTEFGAVADSLEVKDVERFPAIINVTLKTPEGGFDGASTDDLDGSAAGAFKAIYDDVGWRKAATVSFEGGLVNTRTGKNLPNEEVAFYRLERNEARRINWDNAFSVDWSSYRVFLHPAFQ